MGDEPRTNETNEYRSHAQTFVKICVKTANYITYGKNITDQYTYAGWSHCAGEFATVDSPITAVVTVLLGHVCDHVI